jgi:ligand-binding sensor domain-containing protein
VVPSQRQCGAVTIIARILLVAFGCEVVTTRLQQSGSAVALCAWIAWLALLFAAPAHALDPEERFHDYVRDNWSVENGLPQVSVLTITQDSTGYIWLGTQNGIARFDGVRFNVYDRRTTGVDTTMATVSYTDRSGKPWFGTAHGVLRLNQGKLELLRAGTGNAAVQGIAEAADGSMLFATSLGVMRLRDSSIEPAMLQGERTCSLLRDGADAHRRSGHFALCVAGAGAQRLHHASGRSGGSRRPVARHDRRPVPLARGASHRERARSGARQAGDRKPAARS